MCGGEPATCATSPIWRPGIRRPRRRRSVATRPPMAWSPPCSGTGPAGPVTRCCTGTLWSPTWSRGGTAAGAPCTPRISTRRCVPRVRCSRLRCAPRSPNGWGWSGDPDATSPSWSGCRSGCATRSQSGRVRSRPGWRPPAPPIPPRAAKRQCWPPVATRARSKTSGSTQRGRPRRWRSAGDPTRPKRSSPPPIPTGWCCRPRACGGSPTTPSTSTEPPTSVTGWWSPTCGSPPWSARTSPLGTPPSPRPSSPRQSPPVSATAPRWPPSNGSWPEPSPPRS